MSLLTQHMMCPEKLIEEINRVGQVGGDHRCSWPSEGGVFLLKLDLRAGPGGHSLSVLNLQTRGPMRVAEVPFDEDGWRLCGALTGPAAMQCSSTDIGAQEHAVAEMLATAGGEGNCLPRGLEVYLAIQWVRARHISSVD